MGKRFKRMNGEKMRDFQLRCNATLQAEKEQRQRDLRNQRRRNARASQKAARDAAANRVDGLDRDDIGLSPDH